MRNVVGSLTLIGMLATHAFIAEAVAYKYTTIDVPGPGASLTYAYGINNASQIVGFFDDESGDHGFLRNSAGNITIIDVPGAIATAATGINDAGQIVGLFVDPSLGAHAFLRDTGGAFTILAVPADLAFVGTPASPRIGINNVGQIVVRTFVSTDGLFTPTVTGDAFGINNAGQIVGTAITAPVGEHGFLHAGGVVTPFVVPGAVYTEAFGINDAGAIVGLFGEGSPSGFVTDHAFLRDPSGAFTTVEGSVAYGINNAGAIVGVFADDSGNHGFLATAVSEPSTWLLLGSAFVVLAARRFTRLTHAHHQRSPESPCRTERTA